MKTKISKLVLTPALLALCALHATLCTMEAQGTAFTYQGELNNSGSPANGFYDFQFSLFNAPANGNPVGPTITNLALGVTNGLFTTTMDFGPVFTGNDTWLAISVRTNGGGSFTALSPLQELTPAPYATFANTASNVSGSVSATQLSGPVPNASLSGVYGRAVTLSNGNNSFSGSFSGNGANVTNVNAAELNGLQATNFWQLSGNSGTTPGVNFVGTSDNQPLELHVNGQRALRLEVGGPSSSVGTSTLTGAPNVIGGSQLNFVTPGVVGSVIGGGGATNYDGFSYTNSIGAHSDFSVIGGGVANMIQTNSPSSIIAGGQLHAIEAGSVSSTIGGGEENTIGHNAGFSTIGGGLFNAIQTNAYLSTIAGGQMNIIQTNSDESTIGGGNQNVIETNSFDSSIAGGDGNNILVSSDHSTIGGGQENQILNYSTAAVIGGGYQNVIGYDSFYSFIGGGVENDISGFYATVGGGGYNYAAAGFATVPGGFENYAEGEYSFAAGQQAQALNQGAFVWADSQGASFSSTGNDQFLVRAQGGAGFGTNAPRASVDIVSGNGVADPQLRLVQLNGSDYARSRFQTGTLPYWDVAVGGPTDVMNWYLPNYGNVMSLATNGMLTTGGLTVNNGGAIHVTGAGSNTTTAVFTQVATAANIFEWTTIIDNPLCNGNPNAILIVTHVFNQTTSVENHPIGVGYDYGQPNRWCVYNEDTHGMDIGATYNVMVVLP